MRWKPSFLARCRSEVRKTKGADIDRDQDGTPDCLDKCPHDPSRIAPGQCGCVGEANPKPAGTACNDGLCPANTTCDGAGSCGSVQQCAPASNCTATFFNHEVYWQCPSLVTWSGARDVCRSKARTQLVQLDSRAENAFLLQQVSFPTWIGANDLGVKNTWRWLGATSNNGTLFWTGTASGTAPADRYANWRADQPVPLLNDCGVMNPADGGEWTAGLCIGLLPFACETCVRRTCADLGAECGTQPDGCGGTMECGSCASGKVCFQGTGVCSDPTGNECRAAVKLDRTLPPDVGLRKVYQQLASCSQPNLDPCIAQYQGELRFDLMRAASLCQEEAIIPGMHNAVVNDRERKARAARANPAIYCQVATGDGDKDHIPDPIDQCPESPPLTPTMDNGCPDTTPPAGPSIDTMRTIREHILPAYDPACTGGTESDPPVIAFIPATPAYLMVASKPVNQPSGCSFYYEFYMTGINDQAKVVSFHLLFAENEGQSYFGTADHPNVGFAVADPPTTPFGLLAST